jgi:DNA primase
MLIVATSAAEPPNGHGIVEIVARHTQLDTLCGDGGQLGGTCPFCGSRAFRVRPPQGTFHCFGCGEGGDGRRFLTTIETRGQVGDP